MNSDIIDLDTNYILKETTEIWEKLAGKNILITGANGMLASLMVDTILKANSTINKKRSSRIFVLTRSDKKLFGKDKNLTYINCDIAKNVPKIKVDCDFIIHAASKAAPKNYLINQIDTLNTNILGTYNLLKLVTKKFESFLFFSSSEIYSEINSSEKIEETDSFPGDHLNTRACYRMGKKAAETILITYFNERKLPVKIARIFHSFGPRLNLDDGRVYSDFIKQAIKNKNIKIFGDKDVKRAYNYNSNTIVMLLKLLVSDKNGEVYNIGSDNALSVEEFAKIVSKQANKLGQSKVKVQIKNIGKKYYKNVSKKIVPNLRKFRKDFNWKAKIKINKAVEKTLKYYL
jgi:UDP-glucuronate decarboxylase